MNQTRLSIAVACVGLLLPVSAIGSQAQFLPGSKHTCNLHLASGQPYIRQARTFRWKKDGVELYTMALAYYAPATGEFLWWGRDYDPDSYFRYGKDSAKPGCVDSRSETLLLQDGEWAKFWAANCSLWVIHSNLRFRSMEMGWQYVAENPSESSSSGAGKWAVSMRLDDVLGADFFHRPESLHYDARPYMFQPLLGVKKVGSTWELEIQGTDGRALVVLDKSFRAAKLEKSSGNRK